MNVQAERDAHELYPFSKAHRSVFVAGALAFSAGRPNEPPYAGTACRDAWSRGWQSVRRSASGNKR